MAEIDAYRSIAAVAPVEPGTFDPRSLLDSPAFDPLGRLEEGLSRTDARTAIALTVAEELASLAGRLVGTPHDRSHAALERVIGRTAGPWVGTFHLEVLAELSTIERDLRADRSADVFRGSIRNIAELISVDKVLMDEASLSADGLTRTSVSYASPRVLASVRASRGLDPRDCELVIVGGGPAGIAALFWARQAGIDAVLLEGRYFAAAISDSRALAVHAMRTGSAGTSLIRPGSAPEFAHELAGMPELMRSGELRALAAEGRARVEAFELRSFPPHLPAAGADYRGPQPITRGEAYGYFLEVLHRTLESGHVMAVEQAPVTEATWEAHDNRFHVTTSLGHELRPRFLLVAPGNVGMDADGSRPVPVLDAACREHPDRYRRIDGEGSLRRFERESRRPDAPALRPQLVVPDALIGDHGMRELIRELEPGTSVLMIGSGESAAKGALGILELNAAIRVTLIVKGTLYPMQGQSPPFGGFGDVAIRAIEDPDFGLLTRTIARSHFGTPITPESLHDILAGVSSGRIRLIELGDSFCERSVRLETDERGGGVVTRVFLRPERTELRDALVEEDTERRDADLIGETGRVLDPRTGLLGEFDGPVFTAAGYEARRLLESNPLLRALHRAGDLAVDAESGGLDVDSETHLFSRSNTNLAVSGAFTGRTVFDGVFGGSGVRSALVIERIAERLGKPRGERHPFAPISGSGTEFREPDPVKLAVRPNHEYSAPDRFPGEPFLEALARRQERWEDLTAPERILLERGDRFMHQLRMVLRANRVSPI